MLGADDGALDTAAAARRVRGADSADDAYTCTVKEPLLVRDVLYACQGINGKFTTFGDAEQRFVISAQADVPAADRQHMSALMELGFLFKRVQSHLSIRCVCEISAAASTTTMFSTTTTVPAASTTTTTTFTATAAGSPSRPLTTTTTTTAAARCMSTHPPAHNRHHHHHHHSTEHGAIRQALCAALGQECKDFYRFMAVLQGQVGSGWTSQRIARLLVVLRSGEEGKGLRGWRASASRPAPPATPP
jgi:hypothetical protein